ncbi:MAG: sigma-70 family RNA polymerase sigma factor [Deltaproteobacteria bacterium]|nr:sigma-70 family RNA polymerase sigma factor [Deltaproteobacteria bacterium]
MSSEELTTSPPNEADSNRESDEILIARAKGGDFEAFETLITRYDDKVYRLAFRFMRNETEAKEIVQDTLLSVWRKLDTFKGDSQFGSWLFRVTANAALMRLRSQRRHAEVSTEDMPPGFLDNQQSTFGQVTSQGENWARRPDDELQSEELRNQIQVAVDALPEIYRTVFLVRDVDGLSTEETAEALGLSIPTVKTRLHRARLALRDAIGGHFK